MDRYLNLEYRGEGNCAIVFANPQTKQVYRLVKYNATRKIRTVLQASSITIQKEELTQLINSSVHKELENVMSYMNNIMKPILSNRYVVTPKLKIVHKKFGEKAVALAGQARPAHRKNSQEDIVDPDVQCALVLPDCCFVCFPNDEGKNTEPHTVCLFADQTLLNSREPSSGREGDLRLSNRHGHGSQGSSPNRDQLNDSLDGNISAGDDADEVDSFSSAFYLENDELEGSSFHICKSGDDRDLGTVSDSDIIYQKGGSHNESEQSHAIVIDCQEDSSFTLSIEIKPKKAFMTRSSSDDLNQVCRFCMHQHLKTKSGQWPQTSSYCPLDLFSGHRTRMKHALWSLIKTPQNNLKICRNGKEIYGSEIRQNLSAILSAWFPTRKNNLINVFLDLVIEILLTGSSTDHDLCLSEPGAPAVNCCLQKCESSSFVHYDEGQSTTERTEGLPQGCVLEKIFSLQSLDNLDIEGVYPLYQQLKLRMEKEPWLIKHWSLNGPYDSVSWLLGREGEHLNDLEPDSADYAVLKVKRFLVSKTLQDCSIIAAIKPVTKSIQDGEDFLRFDGDLYHYSVKVIDLDPKPFEKVETYHRQASDIAKTFAETSSAAPKGSGGT